MVNIIVVFPKQQDAVNLRNLLARQGHRVIAVCNTGASVMQVIDQMVESDGIIVSGYKYPDMICTQLNAYIPKTYDMLVLSSQVNLASIYDRDIVKVTMPIKIAELFASLDQMESRIIRNRKKRRMKPKERTPQEKAVILKAKEILSEVKGMEEAEAHRYIQKNSMDNGLSVVETAKKIIDIYSVE